MIERYPRPGMGRIGSEEWKYATWLRVELAVGEAWARRGRIPAAAMARIASAGRVDVARILEIQHLERCFDPAWSLRNVDAVFDCAGLL